MAETGHESLMRSLVQGERGGVYFLHGEEEYLKDEAIAAIVDAHLDPGSRDFNLDVLRGTETDAETLASIMQTPPMMAEWRVLVVREAEGLATNSTTRSAVELALERPVPGLALILAARIPPRSKARFYTTLRKRATAVEYAPLSEADVPGWLMAQAEAQGLRMEAPAAQAMAAAVGSNLGVLSSELAKLRDYVADRGAITVEDVAAAVGAVPRVNRWDWLDAVAEQRIAQARRDLPSLLEGDSGVGLVIGLGSHFLRMGIALAGGPDALKAELPRHQSWLARKLPGQARRWTGPALAAALDDLLRADRLLKSAPLSELQLLDELLLRLEHHATAQAAA